MWINIAIEYKEMTILICPFETQYFWYTYFPRDVISLFGKILFNTVEQICAILKFNIFSYL